MKIYFVARFYVSRIQVVSVVENVGRPSAVLFAQYLACLPCDVAAFTVHLQCCFTSRLWSVLPVPVPVGGACVYIMLEKATRINTRPNAVFCIHCKSAH